MRHTLLLSGLFSVIFSCLAVPTIGAENHVQYATLEIQPFAIPPGIDLPSDFRMALQRNLVEKMEKSKRFGRVSLAGDSSSSGAPPSLRLVGSITEFKKGNRAERYLVGPGFGRTVIRAHIQFVDVASGTVKFEKNVNGQVVIGLFGGDSLGATNGLAKDISKAVKKKM